MKNAHKSVGLLTSFVHKCLSADDKDFDDMERIVEDGCNNSEVDHREQRQNTVMLFCCKKVNILTDVTMLQYT